MDRKERSTPSGNVLKELFNTCGKREQAKKNNMRDSKLPLLFFTSILRSSRNIAKNLQLSYPRVYLFKLNRTTQLSLSTAVRK